MLYSAVIASAPAALHQCVFSASHTLISNYLTRWRRVASTPRRGQLIGRQWRGVRTAGVPGSMCFVTICDGSDDGCALTRCEHAHLSRDSIQFALSDVTAAISATQQVLERGACHQEFHVASSSSDNSWSVRLLYCWSVANSFAFLWRIPLSFTLFSQAP